MRTGRLDQLIEAFTPAPRPEMRRLDGVGRMAYRFGYSAAKQAFEVFTAVQRPVRGFGAWKNFQAVDMGVHSVYGEEQPIAVEPSIGNAVYVLSIFVVEPGLDVRAQESYLGFDGANVVRRLGDVSLCHLYPETRPNWYDLETLAAFHGLLGEVITQAGQE